MRFLTKAAAAASLVALVTGVALAEPGPHASGWHGHPGEWRGHAGGWHGRPHAAWRGGVVAPIAPVAPIGPPAVSTPGPVPPYGGCIPTAPRYDAYGAYVAGGC